jgi:hypothetical protein
VRVSFNEGWSEAPLSSVISAGDVVHADAGRSLIDVTSFSDDAQAFIAGVPRFEVRIVGESARRLIQELAVLMDSGLTIHSPGPASPEATAQALRALIVRP